MHKLLLESERTGITTATPPTAASLLRARQPQTLLASPKQSYRERLATDTPSGDSSAPGWALGAACSDRECLSRESGLHCHTPALGVERGKGRDRKMWQSGF